MFRRKKLREWNSTSSNEFLVTFQTLSYVLFFIRSKTCPSIKNVIIAMLFRRQYGEEIDSVISSVTLAVFITSYTTTIVLAECDAMKYTSVIAKETWMKVSAFHFMIRWNFSKGHSLKTSRENVRHKQLCNSKFLLSTKKLLVDFFIVKKTHRFFYLAESSCFDNFRLVLSTVISGPSWFRDKIRKNYRVLLIRNYCRVSVNILMNNRVTPWLWFLNKKRTIVLDNKNGNKKNVQTDGLLVRNCYW